MCEKGIAFATYGHNADVTTVVMVLRMDNIEVLVHIEAPSGFKDDTRYRAQAEAASDFEPCSKLQIYGPEDGWRDLVDEGECFHAASCESNFDTCPSSSWRQTDIVREAPAQLITQQLLKQGYGHGDHDSVLRRGSTAGEHDNDTTRSITWTVRKSQAQHHSPPYHVPPFLGKVAATAVHAAQTPEIARPRTAPAGFIGLKASALRKRARSESSSFESLNSVIPDSQVKRESIASEDLSCVIVDIKNPKGYSAGSIPWETVNEQPTEPPTRPVKRQETSKAVESSQKPEVPSIAQLLGEINVILPKSQTNRRNSKDSTERATTSSDSISMWPPKPRKNLIYAPLPDQDLAPRVPSPASHSMPAPSLHGEPLENWLFSSPLTAPLTQQSLDWNSAVLTLSSISSLPTAIHAPAPPVGHASYTTHLTSSLRTLAKRLPLATFFRPVLVTRDIHILERGYWHLRLPLPTTTSLQLQPAAEPADRGFSRSKNKTPWTEESFLQFWHAFTRHVQSGWSGWGVSIYREDARTASSLEHSGDGGNRRDVILKVTCWGEILAHIYLIMWVLSDKRTEALEMEWRDAGDEVVVKMRSGSKPGRGSLGEYGFKGGEGVAGRWGILT